MLAIPLLLNGEDDESPGLFRLDTSIGHIVVLFRSRQEMDRFARLMAPRMEPLGEVLRWVETDFDRVDDLTASLYAQGFARPGEEHFIGSEHELWADMAQQLEQDPTIG